VNQYFPHFCHQNDCISVAWKVHWLALLYWNQYKSENIFPKQYNDLFKYAKAIIKNTELL
jgi:hypothetical protein